MTSAVAAVGIAALLIFGTEAPAEAPTEISEAGKRVELDSFTGPKEVARCIAANIGRKMPELRVRGNGGESADENGYLILTAAEPAPSTFGVIRIERSESGSHLTTWLPAKSLAAAAPEALAKRLVAGC